MVIIAAAHSEQAKRGSCESDTKISIENETFASSDEYAYDVCGKNLWEVYSLTAFPSRRADDGS